jgi:acyl-CoA hydrolase
VIARVLESVFPTDTNPRGNLFGGTMVAWMDKAAGYAAMRHARNVVVTAAIERIEFAVPVQVGDLVELVARVESVGRSSMRIQVEAFREDPVAGGRELCTHGLFTAVAVDGEGRPTPVPPLPEQPDG